MTPVNLGQVFKITHFCANNLKQAGLNPLWRWGSKVHYTCLHRIWIIAWGWGCQGVKTETLTSESQGKEIKRDNESHEKGRKMYSRSLRTKESGGEGGWLEKEGQEAGGLRRGAGGAGQEVCNGSLGGGQVRTEEVDEHRWIRGQMSLQSKDIQHLSQWNQLPPLSSLYTGCPKKCTHRTKS